MYKFNKNLTLNQIALEDRMALCFSTDEREAVCLIKTDETIKSEKGIRFCEEVFVVASFHDNNENYVCNNAATYKSQKEAWNLFDQIRNDFLDEVSDVSEEFFKELELLK